ncbi:MAG: hypothetical protein FWH14_03455 [Oscillospiraceae bacterium]|nr:hypothetical protein [Oscillospiraceae bacterium]
MKKVKMFFTIVVTLLVFVLVFPVAAAQTEQVTEHEMTFAFGSDKRTGRYTGSIENGVAHGQGKFEWMSFGGNFVHEGEFENGAIQGKGTRIRQ